MMGRIEAKRVALACVQVAGLLACVTQALSGEPPWRSRAELACPAEITILRESGGTPTQRLSCRMKIEWLDPVPATLHLYLHGGDLKAGYTSVVFASPTRQTSGWVGISAWAPPRAGEVRLSQSNTIAVDVLPWPGAISIQSEDDALDDVTLQMCLPVQVWARSPGRASAGETETLQVCASTSIRLRLCDVQNTGCTGLASQAGAP